MVVGLFCAIAPIMKQPNKHSTIPTKRLMQDVICMINQAALLLSASKTSISSDDYVASGNIPNVNSEL
jgi:hypothetical protein